MKNLETHCDRLWFGLLSLLFLFPLLPTGIETVLTIVFVFVSVLRMFHNKKTYKVITIKQVCLMCFLSSIFFIYLGGLLYSSDSEKALDFLIRIAPILFFILVFGLNNNNSLNVKEFEKLKIIYISSIFILLLYLNVRLFESLYFKEITNWQIRQLLEGISKVHGTYLSMWIGFGCILLYSMIKDSLRIKKTRIMIFYIIIT